MMFVLFCYASVLLSSGNGSHILWGSFEHILQDLLGYIWDPVSDYWFLFFLIYLMIWLLKCNELGIWFWERVNINIKRGISEKEIKNACCHVHLDDEHSYNKLGSSFINYYLLFDSTRILTKKKILKFQYAFGFRSTILLDECQ